MGERITNVEVFSIGTWNGHDIEPKDLQDIVRNFGLLGSAGHLPVKLGHDDGQPLSGQPAVGWIDAVRVAPGGKLVADLEIVSDVVMRALRKQLYRHVSVELVKDPTVNGNEYPGYALDALALLGAETPAVSNLEGLARLAAARASTAVLSGPRLSFARPLAAPAEDNDQSAEIARLRAELAAATEANTRAREDFARQRAQETAIAHQRDVLTRLETAVRERRMLPAHRERIITAKNLRDPTAALLFSRQEVELYCDAHDQAPSIALLFQSQARSLPPGGTNATEPEHERLVAAATALFKRGEARDVFHGMELLVASSPEMGARFAAMLDHDLTGR